MNDRILMLHQERLAQLDSARIAAVAHLNAILGGIAEVTLLVEQIQALDTPAEVPAGEAVS